MSGIIRIPGMSFSCKFKAQIFKEDGSIRYDGPWFNNTILNTGLDWLIESSDTIVIGLSSVTTILSQCNVGEGATTPDPSDQGLVEYVASSSNTIEATTERDPEVAYVQWNATFEFGIGSFDNDNLREVGLSRSANSVYLNRQLLRDEDGNATTLTLLSDEGLRVHVAVRQYWAAPIGSLISGTLDINGTSQTIHTEFLEAAVNQGRFGFNNLDTGCFYLVDEAENITGCSSFSRSAYTSGTFYRDYAITWEEGSFEGSINSIGTRIRTGSTHSDFCRIHLSEPVAVTGSQRVELTLRRAINRYNS